MNNNIYINRNNKVPRLKTVQNTVHTDKKKRPVNYEFVLLKNWSTCEIDFAFRFYILKKFKTFYFLF